MAGGNTVTLTFAGDDRNLSRVLSGLAGKTKGAEDGLKKFGVAAAVGLPALGYTAGAVVGLSGAMGLLPAAGLAGAAAIGALTVGFSGFGEAMSSMSDPAKFAEAIGKLSPNARSAALAVQSLQPQLKALKTHVQDDMFKGLSTEIRNLGANYIPALTATLRGVANGFNLAMVETSQWLNSTDGIATMTPLFEGVRVGVANMTGAIAPAIQAFLRLGSVGAGFLPRLGEMLTDAATRFAAFIEQAEKSGQLKQWIEEGLTVFGQLWQVIKDLGATVVNLGLAFESAGLPSALTLISGGLRTVSEFIRDNATYMVPLITGVGLLVAGFKTAMVIVGVVNAIRNATVLWTAAQWLFNAAMWANPVTWIVIAIVALIAIIILCIVYWDEIKAAILSVVDSAVAKWGEFTAWLGSIWESVKQTALAAWTAVALWVGEKIAQVLAVIEFLGSIPGKIGAWFGQAKDWAVGKLTELQGWVSGLPGRILAGLAALGQLGARALAWFGGMVQAGVAKGAELAGWMRGLPGRILSALGNLGSLLVSAGRDVVNGLWRGIQAGWSWITNAVSNLASTLLNAAKSALGIASPSKLFKNEVGRWIPEGLAAGIIANAGVAVQAARSVGEEAAAAAAAAAQTAPTTGIGQAAQAVLNRMKSGGQMFEDLTWRGAPGVVGQFNDQLMDMADARGVRGGDQMRRFLEDVVRQSQARSAPTSSAALAATRTASAPAASAPTTQVFVTVQGSIRSDRDLVELIRDEMDRGGFRGVK